jgi:hypothetical protein
MRRTPMRRIGSVLLAVITVTAGLAAPAQAAGTGSIVGHLTNHGAPVASATVWLHPVNGFTGYTTGIATGTISGRFVDGNGNGIPDVNVTVSQGEGPTRGETTDSDGYYSIPDLQVGSYRVFFARWELNIGQYAYGTTNPDAATAIVVTEGATTTVNDTRLPTGSVRVTAKDALTGAPITSLFYASINNGNQGDSTETGELIFPTVTVGDYLVSGGAPGYIYEQNIPLTVAAGQRTELVLSLTPKAKITTKVVDAVTGAPVADVCLFAARLQHFVMPEDCYYRSEADGTATVEVETTGSYQLFARPYGGVHGAQWVGATGGTGSQLLAKSIQAANGQSVAGPVIRLDAAGTVTGKVTNADGSTPSFTGIVSTGDGGFNSGSIGAWGLDEQGRYTLDFLGPYEWPLLFDTDADAAQWSGGVANRYLATKVKVTSGAVKTYDYTMKHGTTVKVSVPGDTRGTHIAAYNAVTGDETTFLWSADLSVGVTTQVLGPQVVKFAVYANTLEWAGGTDLNSAKPYVIPVSGAKTITLTLG